MKEAEITRFLATDVLQKELFEDGSDYIAIKIDGYWQEFDPIHKIEHAFMVRDAILELDETGDIADKFELAYERYNDFNTLFDVSAERISVSAVRALAADAQIQEMGL